MVAANSSLEMESTLLAAWLSLFVFLFVVQGPVFAWTIRIMWQDWDRVYIVKRGRRTLVFMVSSMFWWQYLLTPSLILDKVFETSQGLHIITALVSYPIYMAASIGPMLVVSRYWLFYFKSQLNRFYKNESWRMAINPNNESRNFFVKYAKTLGNSKYIFKWSSIIGFFWFWYILFVGRYEELSIVTDISILFMYVSITAIGIYLIFKIKYNITDDTLGIRQELIFLAKFAPATLIIIILSTQFINMGDEWIEFIRFGGLSIWVSVICYGIVIYPKKLQLRHLKKQPNDSNNKNDKNNNVFDNLSIEINDMTVSVAKNSTWQSIIVTYNGFELFMNHLGKELSMENLLFIQEYVQIKNVLNSNDVFGEIMDKLASKSKFGRFHVELPPTSASRVQLSTIGDESDENTQNQLQQASQQQASQQQASQQPSPSPTPQVPHMQIPALPEILTSDSHIHLNNMSLHGSINSNHSIRSNHTTHKHSKNSDRFVNSENKYIPESIMAKELRNKIDEIRSNMNENNETTNMFFTSMPQEFPSMQEMIHSASSNCEETNNNNNNDNDINDNNNNNNDTRVNRKSEYVKRFCEAIIEAFESLYNKYIDSSHAIFEVNISSKNRGMWNQLFDIYLYQRSLQTPMERLSITKFQTVNNKFNFIRQKLHNKLAKFENNEIDTDLMDTTMTSQQNDGHVNPNMTNATQTIMSDGNVDNDTNESSKNENGINSDNNENDNDNENIIEWLLKTIMYNVEPSLYEISVLMNDSFSRFKSSKI